MGVWKLKDKRAKPYYYNFEVAGRRYARYGFRTKAEARAAEQRHRTHLVALKNSASFTTLVQNRLEQIRAYSTRKHLTENVCMLKRFAEWGKLDALEITSQMVRNKLISLAEELGNSNANRHLRSLKSVFGLAVKDGLLLRNPCVGVSRLPTTPKPKHIPTKEEVLTLIQTAEPLDGCYFTLIWLTGARIREINYLRWSDVDWEAETVTLRTNKTRSGEEKERQVKLIDRTLEAINFAWENRTPRSPWVFSNPVMVKNYSDPERWNYDYRDKFHKTLARMCNVHYINWHDLRHSAASLMAESGMALTHIQEVLGHERATTTDIYLRSLGKAARTSMERLEDHIR